MKKYSAAKKITVLFSMFLVGSLMLGSAAMAGNVKHDLFVDEKKAKGFSHDHKNPDSAMTSGAPATATHKGANIDHFVEEKKVKGFSHHYKDSDHEGSGNWDVPGSHIGANTDLFSEERMVKGIEYNSRK